MHALKSTETKSCINKVTRIFPVPFLHIKEVIFIYYPELDCLHATNNKTLFLFPIFPRGCRTKHPAFSCCTSSPASLHDSHSRVLQVFCGESLPLTPLPSWLPNANKGLTGFMEFRSKISHMALQGLSCSNKPKCLEVHFGQVQPNYRTEIQTTCHEIFSLYWYCSIFNGKQLSIHLHVLPFPHNDFTRQFSNESYQYAFVHAISKHQGRQSRYKNANEHCSTVL